MKANARRDARGWFLKGHGAPGPGAPKASAEERAARRAARNEREKVRLAVALAAKESEAVMRAAIVAAKAGDMTAASLVLSKTVPACKESPPVKMPGLDAAPHAAALVVMQRIAAGEISAERGELLMSLVNKRAEIEETTSNLMRVNPILDAMEEVARQIPQVREIMRKHMALVGEFKAVTE